MTTSSRRLLTFAVLLALPGAAAAQRAPDLTGTWRIALDLAGGTLRTEARFARDAAYRELWRGELCNGGRCDAFSDVRVTADSVRLQLADYAASITLAWRGDSLVGDYRNVGNRGPRLIPVRASRGRWPVTPVPAWLAGRWDAQFEGSVGSSPRLLEFRDGPHGLEGTVLSATGDYGNFRGTVAGDSIVMSHFDGSFVYHVTARRDGDSLLVGTFHAGLRSQTPFTARPSRGDGHLPDPATLTTADTAAPFRFAFRDLDGRLVTQDDARFRGKVVVVDVFGTWCPTCHDAAPALVQLYRDYRDRGVEMVGLAYEVTGDSAVDGSLVRRYRDKFGITFPLLLAGINDTDAAAATLPQLQGFTSFPTTVFLARDGRIRRVHAGFYGPAAGPRHERQIADFRATLDALLKGSP